MLTLLTKMVTNTATVIGSIKKPDTYKKVKVVSGVKGQGGGIFQTDKLGNPVSVMYGKNYNDPQTKKSYLPNSTTATTSNPDYSLLQVGYKNNPNIRVEVIKQQQEKQQEFNAYSQGQYSTERFLKGLPKLSLKTYENTAPEKAFRFILPKVTETVVTAENIAFYPERMIKSELMKTNIPLVEAGADFIPTSTIDLLLYKGMGKAFKYAPKITSTAFITEGAINRYSATSPQEVASSEISTTLGFAGFKAARKGISKEAITSLEKAKPEVFIGYEQAKLNEPGKSNLILSSRAETNKAISETIQKYNIEQVGARTIQISKGGGITKVTEKGVKEKSLTSYYNIYGYLEKTNAARVQEKTNLKNSGIYDENKLFTQVKN